MTGKRVSYELTMWAAMEPNVYAGESCDEHAPRWHAHAEGNRESEHLSIITLDSKTFPAGTKVSIEVPCCPECGISADFAHAQNTQLCECGFDWKAWAEDQYQ